jgi:hypothetical protein
MQTRRVEAVTDDIVADDELVDAIRAELRSILPDAWEIRDEPAAGASAAGLANPAAGDTRADLVVDIAGGDGTFSRAVFEVKRTLNPRGVDDIVKNLRFTRRFDPRGAVFIVAARWLSPSTQARLDAASVNYLDLTGNASIRMDRPALYVRTVGAQTDPDPPTRGRLTLKGAQAGRLVRALVDFIPPYTTSAIAAMAGISISYASRQLAELDAEALVGRDRRGMVIDRDWAGLLRARAQHYSTLRTNKAATFIAPRGPRALYESFSPVPPGLLDATGPFAVTGSFAAARIAPVAAPTQLMLYADNPSLLARHYELLPADTGADVVLLKADDSGMFTNRVLSENELPQLPVSQIALDCLAGPGRMPAEGEALLEWMAAHPDEWQADIPT